MAAFLKRLRKELQSLERSPDPDIELAPLEDNIRVWNVGALDDSSCLVDRIDSRLADDSTCVQGRACARARPPAGAAARCPKSLRG